MVLLGALYLALNATNNTDANDRVCDFRSKAFDPDACHKYTLNETSAGLRAKIEKASSGAGLGERFASSGVSCSGSFYVLGISEFEGMYPVLRLQQCYISTYGAFMHSIALMHPCRTHNMSGAKFVMFPPFLATECNWPGYHSDYCFGGPNVFRQGSLCRPQATRGLEHFARDHPEMATLVLDQKSVGPVYDAPHRLYKAGNIVFAKVNAHRTFYRPGVDVSMPPAPFPVVMETPEKSWRDSLASKRYVFSFKGQMRTRIRQLVRELHHNGVDRIIVDRDEDAYDFKDLLYNTRFNLILRGDMEFSYRFNEVVCSGGIPVMLTENWIPPFDAEIPFETYGIRYGEDKAPLLPELLMAQPLPKLARMRNVARKACNRYFRTPATQVAALIHSVLDRNASGAPGAGGDRQEQR